MHTALRCLISALVFTLVFTPAGCDRQEPDAQTSQNGESKSVDRRADTGAGHGGVNWVPERMGEYPIKAYDNYTETGDLDAIKRHGKLRILVDISNTDSLHRAATQQDIELDQARRLAGHLGLEPVVLYVESFDELIPQLLAGKGDIIANNLTITEERREKVSFSIPTASTKMVLVSRQDEPAVGKNDQLKGKTLVVTDGTTYEATANEFVRKHPGLELEDPDKNYVNLAIEVAKGNADFTILDETILDLVLQFRNDLKKNLTFPDKQELAWAVRPNSPQLLDAINDKVRHVKLTRSTERFTGDLDEIKKRGVLRAATRNNAGSYFMWKGRILGYEYELLQDFARGIGVRLEIIVAPEHDDFIELLNDGKADIAANLLAITPKRKQQGMQFSEPTHAAKVGVVSQKGKGVKNLQSLSGRAVCVRAGSSHYDLLQRIQQQVSNVKFKKMPETTDIQQIFDKVARGECDLTFADDLTVRMERSWRSDIEFSLTLEDAHDHAWMMRQTNPRLTSAVNKFLKQKKTQKKLRQLYGKYFDAPKRTRPEITELTAKGKISPFDALVQKYAGEYDFDWRLVVAQMFQESSFNPKAKSWVGARGLMQVMPDTGKQVGESNLFDPETSVRAGLKYLDWLHKKFANREDIAPENEMWFTLAAYNAGLGHVYDAKDLAEEMGWDRKVWFGNVEKAMLLLAQKKYYQKARYGYARGQEPVDYVRKIEARFRTYVGLLDAYRRQQQITSAIPYRPGFQPATAM